MVQSQKESVCRSRVNPEATLARWPRPSPTNRGDGRGQHLRRLGQSAYRDGEFYSHFSPEEREILKSLE